MKVSTYGIWENARLELVRNLVKLKLDELKDREQELNALLLDDVITALMEKAYACQDDIAKNHPDLSLKEKVLLTHQQSLMAVLPCLSSKLNISAEKIQREVELFCESAYQFSETHVDYLLRLAQVSGSAKNEIIDELYGSSFRNQHAALARRLQFNDAEVLRKATEAVRQDILHSCPGELQKIMQEHCIYMQEVASQKEPNSTFCADFLAEMHQTMEDFKQQIKEQKQSLRFFKPSSLDTPSESAKLILK